MLRVYLCLLGNFAAVSSQELRQLAVGIPIEQRTCTSLFIYRFTLDLRTCGIELRLTMTGTPLFPADKKIPRVEGNYDFILGTVFWSNRKLTKVFFFGSLKYSVHVLATRQ